MSNILREAFFTQSLEFVISQLDLPFPLSLPTFLQAIYKEKSMYVFLFHLNSSLLCVVMMIISMYGEGNGTLLQYSCLENPMDGGAW